MEDLRAVKADPGIQADIQDAAKALGQLGYRARLAKYGLKHIQDVARENGKRGGRPRKPLSQLSAAGKYQRIRREKLRNQGGR